MTKRLHYIVSGKVQGVLFRDFAKRMADKFGLLGFVRNLPNDTVEAVAEGEEEKLQDFLEHLKKGPTFAQVKEVKAGWQNPTGEFTDFRILYD